MRRICLSLLFLLAVGDVAARDVRLSSPDGGGGSICPTDATVPLGNDLRKPAPAARDTAPLRESRLHPTVHGDVGNVPRLRWHSFLPGMFR